MFEKALAVIVIILFVAFLLFAVFGSFLQLFNGKKQIIRRNIAKGTILSSDIILEGKLNTINQGSNPIHRFGFFAKVLILFGSLFSESEVDFDDKPVSKKTIICINKSRIAVFVKGRVGFRLFEVNHKSQIKHVEIESVAPDFLVAKLALQSKAYLRLELKPYSKDHSTMEAASVLNSMISS